MLDRIEFAAYSAYLKAQRKFNELKNREDGMETLETIILVAVAIIVAVLIVNFLTRNGFEHDGEECGIIEYIFANVGDKLEDIFDAEDVA